MSDHDLASARRAVVQSPQDLAALISLAWAYDRVAGATWAQVTARRGLAVDPGDDAALYLIARNLLAAGDVERAAPLFQQLALRNSRYGRFERLLFSCMTEQTGTCLLLLRELVGESDLSSDQYLLLSRAAYAIDDRLIPLAIRLLRKAIALDPAAVGRLEKIGSYRYGTCGEVAGRLWGIGSGAADAAGPQSNIFPFCCWIDRATVMPDGSVLTDDGALILNDIVPAPLTLVVSGNRILGSSPIRELINLAGLVGASARRVLLNVPARERVIPGAALLFGGNQNFSHLVNDFLSKFPVVGQAGPWERIILSANCHGAAEDFLMALGIARQAIVRQSDNERIRADRLLVPSVGHRFPDLPVLHVAWLRRQFRRPAPPLEGRKRLFISRAGSTGRNIENADALHLLFAEFGIEEMRLDLLSFDEQLNRLAACELILGATGGGSASCYFVPDDCAMIELYFPGAGVLSGQPGRILEKFGHRYQSIECERIPFGPAPDSDGDMRVPLDRLQAAIEAALKSSRPDDVSSLA